MQDCTPAAHLGRTLNLASSSSFFFLLDKTVKSKESCQCTEEPASVQKSITDNKTKQGTYLTPIACTYTEASVSLSYLQYGHEKDSQKVETTDLTCRYLLLVVFFSS